MTEPEISDDTRERFAISVENLPGIYAQEEYEAMVEEEKRRIVNEVPSNQ